MSENKKILFIMPLRNRPERAIASIKSIAESSLKDHFECLIVQDFDVDNVSDADFKNIGIPVSVVNQSIGGLFYKTYLMNFGIAITSHMIIVQQDADILYSEPFLGLLVNISQDEKHFKKYIFGAPYFESDDMKDYPVNLIRNVVRKKGDYVGDTFIFYRPQIETVRGYDERMRMWHEEVDIVNRITYQFGAPYYDMGVVGIRNVHVTHENNLRSFDNSERVKNTALVKDNFEKTIRILNWQLPGGIVESGFKDKKILHRNNEGDSTAFRKNLIEDVYSLGSIQLSKDSVVLDIGAHIGCFALAISDRVKEVICYEPETANFLLLQKNIERNGLQNIFTHKKAVASTAKEIDFFVNPFSLF